jgi:putative GTP pyrophosphokinase
MTIDIKTYSRMITDLVGVRALHLFKEDWHIIHDFIVHTWDLQKKPVANICEGDHEEFINRFKEKGCMIHRHPFGYRSVHYVVAFSPSRVESTMVEIQVRTLLEEAWSEIDLILERLIENFAIPLDNSKILIISFYKNIHRSVELLKSSENG